MNTTFLAAAIGATLLVLTAGAVYFLGLPILTDLAAPLSALGGTLKVGTVSVNQMFSNILFEFVAAIVIILIGAIIYLFAASQRVDYDSGALNR